MHAIRMRKNGARRRAAFWLGLVLMGLMLGGCAHKDWDHDYSVYHDDYGRQHDGTSAQTFGRGGKYGSS